MARTEISIQELTGPFPGTVSANDLDITWTAGDAANDNKFELTGREILLVRNDDGSAQTFDITSVADPYNRSGTISTYSVGAGEYAAIALLDVTGWRQTDGYCYIDNVSSANLKFAVLRLP